MCSSGDCLERLRITAALAGSEGTSVIRNVELALLELSEHLSLLLVERGDLLEHGGKYGRVGDAEQLEVLVGALLKL